MRVMIRGEKKGSNFRSLLSGWFAPSMSNYYALSCLLTTAIITQTDFVGWKVDIQASILPPFDQHTRLATLPCSMCSKLQFV